MPLSNDQVTKIARLARLNLTPEEIERFSHELTVILEYVDQLRQVDTSGIVAHQPAETPQAGLRADHSEPSLPQSEALRNAPQAKDGFFVVPKVLP
jgi:aspartyl-tRNA(Asn)/glutamyl-tRNA(Gln) amidotransferase subunit C